MSGRRGAGEGTKRNQARKAAEILILRPVRFVAGRVKFILLTLAVVFLGATLLSDRRRSR